MKKNNLGFVVVFGALFAFYAFLFPDSAAAEWQKPIQPSLSGGALTCLAIHPLDPEKFLLASEHSIFEKGRENAWQMLWSQAGANTPFKRLFSFSSLPDFIFALSSDKVFLGELKNRSWQEVYQNSNRVPLSLAIHPDDPDRWWVGTERGLWETGDGGKTWSPSPLFRDSDPVPLVLFDKERLLFATENKLYVSSAESAGREVFALPATEKDLSDVEEVDPDKAGSVYLSKIHDLLSTQDNSAKLFLATQDGVFQSLDHGYRWEPLSRSGLQSASVSRLAYSSKENRLYAATPRGIYEYDPRSQSWTELFEGLARDGAEGLAVLNEEKLLAITEEGFVQYPLTPLSPEAGPGLAIYQPAKETLSLFKELLSMEPTAREVHKRVIRYADVANGKIKRWQALSRVASFLPSLSMGKTMYRNSSISSYSGKFITGPEDVNKTFDTDLRWELGDMLYSSDQTSIDSREKLMVELRNDLLSEATRIYYERRRLQIGLLFTPAPSEQEHLESLLRVDELTTLLDGMTDGFFSKRLEQAYNARPELSGLWEYRGKPGSYPALG